MARNGECRNNNSRSPIPHCQTQDAFCVDGARFKYHAVGRKRRPKMGWSYRLTDNSINAGPSVSSCLTNYSGSCDLR